MRVTDLVIRDCVLVICLQLEYLLKPYLLSHILKNKLLIPNGMLATAVNNFCFHFFLVVEKLRKRILFTKGIHIFKKSAFVYLDFKRAVQVYFCVGLRFFLDEFKLCFKNNISSFPILLVIKNHLMLMNLLVLDEAYPGFGLRFPEEVAAGDVFIVSFEN